MRKAACLIVMVVVTAAWATEPFQVDDFEDGDTSNVVGAPWVAFSDARVEGKSTGEITVVESKALGSTQAMRLSGELALGFANPFAGVATYIARPGDAQDLSAYTGVRFQARGDGGSYTVQVLTNAVEDHNEFTASFVALDAWSLVEVPFDTLRQSPWWGKKVEWGGGADVRGVGFQTDGGLGAFWLEVDQIEFY